MRPLASAAAAPAWASATATVVADDMTVHRDVARLMAAAGFAVRAEPGPQSLIVLVTESRAAACLRDIRTLAEEHPSAAIVVVVSADVSNAALRRVLLAGATGIVFAQDVERALVPTARAVLAGQLTVPIALGHQIAPRPLSHREKQILALVVVGMTNREIANKLYLAESTVKTHLSSAFRKIDARSRSEAVAKIQDPDSPAGFGVLAVANGFAG